ncbi:MAG: L-seryl-tRNA(Sec) selenium transferase [bacterium]|nr:L-seryl-tRNA(Sec) selenium transferase [bacterium]
MRPPSVDALARSLVDTGLPHPLLVAAARKAIAEAASDHVSDHHIVDRARQHAFVSKRAMLQPVINATGVLLHTNLGRAPLATTTEAVYTNLELDLVSGERGSRHAHAASLLAQLCGAEDAIVVNNCAGAVMLVLAALANGRGAAVSRGELVEIGGGFRVPEVMMQSGAHLVEVGTTNRTRLGDFTTALNNPTHNIALALKVHQSNYRIVGFTQQVSVAEMASVEGPVVADIGSGLIDAACPWLENGPPIWLEGEPAARQCLDAGAALVTFSGDKLFGGPQAGIIAGQAHLVRQCAQHPLARALRPGGLVLGAVQQVALAYLNRNPQAIEFWRMACISPAHLQERAEAIANRANHTTAIRPTPTTAITGGGTLPGVEIPSFGLVLDGNHAAALRAHSPPVVAHVREDCTWLDLRTVAPSQDEPLTQALRAVA